MNQPFVKCYVTFNNLNIFKNYCIYLDFYGARLAVRKARGSNGHRGNISHHIKKEEQKSFNYLSKYPHRIVFYELTFSSQDSLVLCWASGHSYRVSLIKGSANSTFTLYNKHGVHIQTVVQAVVQTAVQGVVNQRQRQLYLYPVQ